MCGLAGFIDTAQEHSSAVQLLQGMLARIAHRGPDDEGCWFERGIALGHRRLAIVELSPLGHQPMASASGRHVMVFNGEIYNHAALRAELEQRGARFRGHSDTEVLLELIERFGLAQAVQRCVGMFAVVVWDREEGVLRLARDRFGEKPLYYAHVDRRLLFGSELKALLAHPAMDRRIDPQSVHDVLAQGHVRAPHSIFAAARQVEPGGIVEFRVDRSDVAEPRLQRYWSHAEASAAGLQRPFTGSFDDAVQAVTQRLEESVSLQMQADVPLGAFLSGGIDSSLVVALMQRYTRQPVRTYSIGFHHDTLDEAAHARAVARHLGTAHTEWYVDAAEALSLVPSLAQHYDEPLADASQLPTLILARLTRRDVTVALSGDGADELFGGYPKYALGRRLLQRRGRRLVGCAAGLLSRGVTRPLSRVLPGALSRQVPWHRVDAVAAVFGARSNAAMATHLSALNRQPRRYMAAALRTLPQNLAAAEHPGLVQMDYRRQAMLADTQNYLCGDILVKVDRATMAASLESRAPFLDHRVLELAASLPSAHLFDGDQGKRVLRAALRRLVPAELVDRPKAGFIPPLGGWLRGPLRSWAEDTLASAAAAQLLDVAACRQLLALHCSSRFDFSARLWPMLTLAAWSERWIGRSPE